MIPYNFKRRTYRGILLIYATEIALPRQILIMWLFVLAVFCKNGSNCLPITSIYTCLGVFQ